MVLDVLDFDDALETTLIFL